MGKTVFGIPGINEKGKGGGAVAPGGTGPGGAPGQSASDGKNSGEGEPEKQGSRDTQPKADEQSVAKPQPAQPKTGEPAVAKPKPAQSPTTGGSPMKGAGKTVFGMPAMKVPGQPGGAPAGAKSPEPVKKETSSGEVKVPRQDSKADASAGPAGADDAYMATMIGTPAVTSNDVDSAIAKAKEETRQKTDSSKEAGQEKVETGQEDAEQAEVQDESHIAEPDDTIDTDGEQPRKGLSATQVVILIVSALIVLGAMGFAAWNFLLS